MILALAFSMLFAGSVLADGEYVTGDMFAEMIFDYMRAYCISYDTGYVDSYNSVLRYF